MDIEKLTQRFRAKEIDGAHLARLVSEGELTKSDRRKITRQASKKELTPRQLLRLESKAKKHQPKLTAADRHQKYVVEKNDEMREKKMQKGMVCLGCREEGHILKYCTVTQTPQTMKKLICFNCGKYDHALRACQEPQVPGFLPFAECFICKQKGHISKDCTENPNGLYPHGGCCHICFKKDHLVKNCPQKGSEEADKTADDRDDGREIRLNTRDDGQAHGDDEDIYVTQTEVADDEDEGDEDGARKKKSKKKRKRTD